MVVRVRCSDLPGTTGPMHHQRVGGWENTVGLRQAGEYQAQGAVRPHRIPHEPHSVGHDVRNPDKAITPIGHPT